MTNTEEIFYKQQGNEEKLFEYAYNNQLPLLIKGPTGCGKTRFIRYMAEKLGRNLHTVSCHDDLSATDLVGRHLISEKGTYWCDGPLTRAVRDGGICYLDEVVEARKDTTVVLHPLTDDRRILPIERTGETLKASDEFMLVVSYNPGYQNLLKGMKPSTRQRFVAISFDFPSQADEIDILLAETNIDKNIAEKLVSLVNSMRSLKESDLEEVPSTRLLIYTANLIISGMSIIDACEAGLVEPLTDDKEVTSALMEVVKAMFGD